VIPKINRGGRMGGLIRYLVGPGERNEHTDPHLVAGDERLLRAWEGYDLSPRYNPSAAGELAAHLEAARRRTGARVTVARRDGEGKVLLDERGAQIRADAHVWHCSLSLHPDEPSLDDEQWKRIAEEFIDHMGLGGQRWLAIRHGRSAGSDEHPAGNDHIHLVVQLVDEHGKSANVHNDRPRAQEACRQLERTHGLRVVEGRAVKRGARATDHRQRHRAQREHQQAVTGAKPAPTSPEPDRELLERAVRRLAAASASEGEFVRRLRAEGLIVRPRFAAGREDQVIGYSVALTPAEGKEVVPHAGGRLAKDLTLPRLRGACGWTADNPGAVDEWRRAFTGAPAGVGAESNPWLALPSWTDALEQLRALRASAEALPTGEHGAWAHTAAHGASVLYGWAQLTGERDAAVLRELGRELSLSAQIRAAQAHTERPIPLARSVAVLSAALARPANQTLFWLALAQELQALAIALHDMHQAAGEAQRAAALATAVRDQLAPLAARLDDEHAAADSDYAETRSALRLARAGQQPLRTVPRPQPSPPASARRPRPGEERKPRRSR
jgi:hypothetical protein